MEQAFHTRVQLRVNIHIQKCALDCVFCLCELGVACNFMLLQTNANQMMHSISASRDRQPKLCV